MPDRATASPANGGWSSSTREAVEPACFRERAARLGHQLGADPVAAQAGNRVVCFSSDRHLLEDVVQGHGFALVGQPLEAREGVSQFVGSKLDPCVRARAHEGVTA